MEVPFVLAIYMVPTMLALSREIPNKGSTIAVNILLGWTLIGWLIALGMALGNPTRRSTPVIVHTNFASAQSIPPPRQPVG